MCIRNGVFPYSPLLHLASCPWLCTWLWNGHRHPLHGRAYLYPGKSSPKGAGALYPERRLEHGLVYQRANLDAIEVPRGCSEWFTWYRKWKTEPMVSTTLEQNWKSANKNYGSSMSTFPLHRLYENMQFCKRLAFFSKAHESSWFLSLDLDLTQKEWSGQSTTLPCSVCNVLGRYSSTKGCIWDCLPDLTWLCLVWPSLLAYLRKWRSTSHPKLLFNV